MESIRLNPLLKAGPFLAIMSYYDYAHVWAFLTRSLSKSICQNSRKWENGLTEVCRRLTIYISDKNFNDIYKFLKFRDLKFINLSLEFRTTSVIKDFSSLLEYFYKMKQTDIDKYEQLCAENPDKWYIREQYVAKNYIRISCINTIPIKSLHSQSSQKNFLADSGKVDMSDPYTLLWYLCPNMFSDPIAYVPNVIKINLNEYSLSEQEIHQKCIPEEIENPLKYNPLFDTLNVDVTNLSINMLLENEKLPATRLIVRASSQLDDSSVDWLFSNKTFSDQLKYLCLDMPQDGVRFMSEFTKCVERNNSSSDQVTSSSGLANLQQLVIKYDFKNLENLIEYFQILTARKSSEELGNFKENRFWISKLIVIDQNSHLDLNHKSGSTGCSSPSQKYEFLAGNFVNHFELQLKGQFVIRICGQWYVVRTSTPLRIASKSMIDFNDKFVSFTMDAMIELNADTEVYPDSSRKIDTHADEYSDIFEVPISSIVQAFLVINEDEMDKCETKYASLCSILKEANPSAQCNLRIDTNQNGGFTEPITNLYRIAGDWWSQALCDSLSPEVSQTIQVLEIRFSGVTLSFLENWIYLKKINSVFDHGWWEGSDNRVLFDNQILTFLPTMPSLEYVSLIISTSLKKLSIEQIKRSLGELLIKNKRLR